MLGAVHGCLNDLPGTHTFHSKLNICCPVFSPDSASVCPAATWTLPSRVSQAPQAHPVQSPCLWDSHLGPGATISQVSTARSPRAAESLPLAPSPTPPSSIPPLWLNALLQPTPLLPPAYALATPPGNCNSFPAGPPAATMAFSEPSCTHLAAGIIFLKCKSELVGPTVRSRRGSPLPL